MALPFIPLFKVFMAPSVHAALKPVLESGRLATGPKVAEFESCFAAWVRATEAAATSDASGALTLALYLAGVRPGDEVITSPVACSATVSPIANLFATPVWCDINPRTGMPDADHIEAAITEKTRAVLFYYWSGDVADVGDIQVRLRRRGIKLIEDASEALGAEWHGRRLGGVADFTVYSFYATKHITTGEGAMLLAANPGMVRSARHLRRFGIDPSKLRLPNGDLNIVFDIPLAGFNFPMNEMAAVMGMEHLTHADRVVSQHRANGRYYDNALAGISGLTLLDRPADGVSGYWTYSLLAERRDDLIRKLLSNGIGAQRLHLRNDGYSCFAGGARLLPGVAAFDLQNLSIPCGWWVGDAERAHVVDVIRAGW